jgi:hypothetical protein
MNIKLSTTDLRWAHWRNIPPESRPQNTSFSLDAALQNLQKLEQIRSNEYQINWHKLKLTIGMSREEAHFWIEAIYKGSARYYTISVKTVVDYMSRAGVSYDGKLGLQELLNSPLRPAKEYGIFYSGYHIIPAFVLLNTADFVHFMNAGLEFNYIGGSMEDVFRLHILPYLSLEEKAAFREAIRPYLLANDVKLSHSGGLIGIAGLVGGMDTELESYLNQSAVFVGNYISDRLAAFGLSSREKVEHYVRSKKMILSEEYVQAWLAHTELDGLDWLAHSIAQYWRGAAKEKSFKVFKDLLYPEAVLPVLSLWEEDNASSVALKWLVNNPRLVAETLVPLAFTQHPQAALIQKYLQRMHSMQQTALLEVEMLKLDEVGQARFRAEILGFHQAASDELDESKTPAWLKDGIASLPDRAGMAPWVDILALPPLRVNGLRLKPAQIKEVLRAIRLHQQDSFVNAIKEHISLEEREAFVWALLQSWIDSAAPHEESWVLNALARLGGDGIVLKLVPLIQRWPGIDHQNRNAKRALDVLRDIGSDTAFLELKKLSKNLHSEALRRKADTRMQDIARQRGLNQLELEDRLIPDCGLDENGTRVFDYGSRQFTLILSPDMKVMIREESGKLRPDLPKAIQSDDASLAAQAAADWELIRSQIKEVVKVQTPRLEAAMIRQRRWSLADFQTLFVQHPLMIHLVRRLIWGAYDETGKLFETFRVDDGRSLLNAKDFAIPIAQLAYLGIVHPAELDDSTRQIWAEILSDYELIPPFPQLARKVSMLEAVEADSYVISRFAHHKIEGRVLRSILEKSGWRRSYKQEGGLYYFGRYFPVGKTLVIVLCSDIPNSPGTYFDHQSLEQIYFIHDPQQHYIDYQSYKEEERMRLGDVPPVTLSETLRVLYATAAKAVKL